MGPGMPVGYRAEAWETSVKFELKAAPDSDYFGLLDQRAVNGDSVLWCFHGADRFTPIVGVYFVSNRRTS